MKIPEERVSAHAHRLRYRADLSSSFAVLYCTTSKLEFSLDVTPSHNRTKNALSPLVLVQSRSLASPQPHTYAPLFLLGPSRVCFPTHIPHRFLVKVSSNTQTFRASE